MDLGKNHQVGSGVMRREAGLVLTYFTGSETTCASYAVKGSEKMYIFYVLCKLTLSRMDFRIPVIVPSTVMFMTSRET